MNSPEVIHDSNSVHKALQGRITRYALDHLEYLDPRSSVLLSACGVLVGQSEVEGAEHAHALFSRGTRLRAPAGPYAFVRDPDAESVAAVNMVDRLLDRHVPTRSLAMLHCQELARMGTVGAMACTTLRAHEAIAVGDTDEWARASLAIHDAFRNDFQCNLAALSQSIALRYEDGYRSHLDYVLRPSHRVVDTMPAPAFPVDDATAAAAQLDDWASCAELERALDLYCAHAGVVPLRAPYSMAFMVDAWMGRNPGAISFDRIQRWADETTSATSRYHFVQLLLERPHLVPNGKAGEVWEAFARILVVPEQVPDASPWMQGWRLRIDLARHYCQHISLLRHGSHGQTCALVAWNCAELVARMFGDDDKAIAQFRARTLATYVDHSKIARLVTHPALTPSRIYYDTLFSDALWSTAITSLVIPALAVLGGPPAPVQAQITDAIVRSMVLALPEDAGPQTSVFLSDTPLSPIVEPWCVFLDTNAGDSSPLRAASSALVGFCSQKDFARVLSQLGRGNESEDLIISSYLRRLAYAGSANVDEVWDRMSNAEWRSQVLHNLDPHSLSMLLEALVEVQINADTKWRVRVSHFLALSTVAVSSDSTRRQILYAMTVCSCVASSSVSALRRLRASDVAPLLREDTQLWLEHLRALTRHTSGWVAGKARAAAAELS